MRHALYASPIRTARACAAYPQGSRVDRSRVLAQYYMLKTMNKKDLRCLRRILPSYADHLDKHPGSLLPRRAARFQRARTLHGAARAHVAWRPQVRGHLLAATAALAPDALRLHDQRLLRGASSECDVWV